MAKVFIGVGHGGLDPGAVANGLTEKEINLVMALRCKAELERHGVEVGMSRLKDEADTLEDEVKECNAFAPDCAIEVHNNAGGGDGFEVYYQTSGYRAQSRLLASSIEVEVKKIGQNSRGIKTRLTSTGTDYFGWLRGCTCPAVLLEGAFLDNKLDAEIIDTVDEQEKFGVAYAKGVLAFLGIEWISKEANYEAQYNLLNEKWLKLQCCLWAIKETIEEVLG